MMNAKTVASRYTLPVGAKPEGIAIADLNGDGKGDNVVANSGDDYINVIFSK